MSNIKETTPQISAAERERLRKELEERLKKEEEERLKREAEEKEAQRKAEIEAQKKAAEEAEKRRKELEEKQKVIKKLDAIAAQYQRANETLRQQQSTLNNMAQENAKNQADLKALEHIHLQNQVNIAQIEEQRIALANNIKVLIGEANANKEMALQTYKAWEQERKDTMALHQQHQNTIFTIQSLQNDIAQIGASINAEMKTIATQKELLTKKEEETRQENEKYRQQELYLACLNSSEVFSIPAMMYLDTFRDMDYQPIQVSKGDVMEILFKHIEADKLISVKISETNAQGTGWLEELDMTRAYSESQGWDFWEEHKEIMSENYGVTYAASACEVKPTPPPKGGSSITDIIKKARENSVITNSKVKN